MNTRTLLLIVLIVVIVAVLPRWPYNAGWRGQPYGYYPAGGLGLVLVILLILALLGYL
jgi:uncharacterized protein DUF3309